MGCPPSPQRVVLDIEPVFRSLVERVAGRAGTPDGTERKLPQELAQLLVSAWSLSVQRAVRETAGEPVRLCQGLMAIAGVLVGHRQASDGDDSSAEKVSFLEIEGVDHQLFPR